jgi:hypothetical protein
MNFSVCSYKIQYIYVCAEDNCANSEKVTATLHMNMY